MSSAMPRRLSHIGPKGRVRMVDVGRKPVTVRVAVARARVFMHRDTLDLLRDGRAPKGDVLATAHVAGVMAAKRTSEIIPLAHTLALEDSNLDLSTMGITPIATSVVYSNEETPESDDFKLEGLAILNRNIVALVNDNDFGVPAEARSKMWVVRLANPID